MSLGLKGLMIDRILFPFTESNQEHHPRSQGFFFLGDGVGKRPWERGCENTRIKALVSTPLFLFTSGDAIIKLLLQNTLRNI